MERERLERNQQDEKPHSKQHPFSLQKKSFNFANIRQNYSLGAAMSPWLCLSPSPVTTLSNSSYSFTLSPLIFIFSTSYPFTLLHHLFIFSRSYSLTLLHHLSIFSTSYSFTVLRHLIFSSSLRSAAPHTSCRSPSSPPPVLLNLLVGLH